MTMTDEEARSYDLYEQENDIPEVFNTKDYICEFYFVKTGLIFDGYYQKVFVDLCLKTTTIEIFKAGFKFETVRRYRLDEKMDTLLPLVRWKDFEKTRDISKLAVKSMGYRDGWGYRFKCKNESGKPPIENYLRNIFDEPDKPAYEKLLDWVTQEYSHREEFEKYKLRW
jgi:hypothetical protein